MFAVFLSGCTVTDYDGAAAANQTQFKKFFASMPEQGICLARTITTAEISFEVSK